MEETPIEPPIQPGERIEHHEVTERVTPGVEPRAPARRGTPMWAWILPLVVVVLFLAWYVLTRGEPSSPLSGIQNVEIEAPDVDIPSPTIENNTSIELPDAPAPAAAGGGGN